MSQIQIKIQRTIARLLSSGRVDPYTVDTLVACRLIALNKNLDVRGVGEVIRRIIEKCIRWVLKKDIQEAAGPLQMENGLQSDAEAAIHSMKEIFDDKQTDVVILVDASIAFNSLNRNAALHNIQILCPQFSTILINTYGLPVRMIVFGSKDMVSNEGTAEGDNLIMCFYAVGTATLSNYLLISSRNVKNLCLADDITGAGKLVNSKKSWSKIISEGLKFGYYVNEDKSLLNEAQQIFSNFDIKFSPKGKRHLGVAIGSSDFRKVYATEKVNNWCEEINKLSEYVKIQPHAAYSAVYHGEVHKVTHFQKKISDMHSVLNHLMIW